MAYKLTVELVPKTAWGNNLRKLLPRDDWDKLRRAIYAAYGYQCAICDARGQLHCHEQWSYDDQCFIQSLKDVIPICVMCHHVKHLGHAGILANEGKLDYEGVIRHFMRVNECTRADFEWAKNDAFQRWRWRSRFKWRLELGELVEVTDV